MLLPPGYADSRMMRLAATTALSRANVDAKDVGLSHLHAMGNAASDIPELKAIAAAVASPKMQRTDPLVIAGHKANMGHTVKMGLG